MDDRSTNAAGTAGVHTRARYWYTVGALVATAVLVGWGGFVTSIDAGLAVPDWPSSFNSYDPFNPWPEWWTLTPVLAEHGHRLLGALVGLLTMGLAVWTWFADARRWIRYLGVAALVLVSLQGVLGGLRVVWISLDLAVVHACVAQLFFALLAAMALFNARTWLEAPGASRLSDHDTARGKRLTAITAALIYVQIILGALLRHPGTGIDTTLAVLHIVGASTVTIFVGVLFFSVRPAMRGTTAGRLLGLLGGIVVAQVALGLTAYLVLLDESGVVVPSNLQVVVNTAHLLLGFALFTTTVLSAMVIGRLEHAARAATTTAPAPSFNLA